MHILLVFLAIAIAFGAGIVFQAKFSLIARAKASEQKFIGGVEAKVKNEEDKAGQAIQGFGKKL